MIVKSKTAYMYLLNTAFLLTAIPMWLNGWLQKIYTGDQTGLSLYMGILFLVTLGLAHLKMWKTVHFVGDMLVLLGLIGTVLGFIIAFSPIVPEMSLDFSSIVKLMFSLIAGIGVAMYTTLVGAVGFLWLRINEALFHGVSS